MKPSTILFSVMSLGFAHGSVAQVVYKSQHDVLVQAIKKGHVEGNLTGPVADLFSRQFRSQGALLVKAKVIGSFPQAECKRIQMIYTKKDVIGQKGPQALVMNTELNYCLDGRPPAEMEDHQ
jgi:hypothetical protein